MKLNGNKFQHLRYSKIPYAGNYETPDGNTITPVEETVDLGILIENSGKVEAQIKSIAQKRGRMAGWVLRVFATRKQHPMLLLYNSFVLA